MLYKYIVALLVLGRYHVIEVVSENNNKAVTFVERVTNALERKCAHNTDQIRYDNIKKELQHLKNDCFNLYIGPEQITEEKLTSICHEQSEKFLQCLTTFAEKLDPCLEPKEKEVKQFVLDIFKDSTEFFCDQIKILKTDRVLRRNTAKCIRTFKENPEINPHIICFKNSTIVGDYPRVDIITKQELCLDVMQTNFCYFDLLDEHCPEAVEVATIQRGLISTAIDKCVPVLVHGTTVTPPSK